MGSLPTGTVTFVFTDIEGSTRLLHELGPERYAVVRARTLARVREASDPDEVDAAWLVGRTLSLDEGVREALAV
jgi:class 3 adenylate cyclase